MRRGFCQPQLPPGFWNAMKHYATEMSSRTVRAAIPSALENPYVGSIPADGMLGDTGTPLCLLAVEATFTCALHVWNDE